ncbi:hypothetical protein CesoFtcFv8_005668 [Champsocephalus esox]|uniref:Serotransferrin n=1 Tax=Champsocephalus esox TaxID=159716 RepID=A0AAN8CSX9_9TELE|nr:hypothetical protein CesoFtcFv8_005668 [Champsocephalus esox]
MQTLLLAALLGSLAAVSAVPTEKVRWCVKSEKELEKCVALAAKAPAFACSLKPDTMECIKAIAAGEADAITLDGGDIYIAGMNDFGLAPIIAEDYGTTSSDRCSYAVAVVKKGTAFNIKELQGKKSCHSGVGESAGWNAPVGTLLAMNLMPWAGVEDSSVEDAVSSFFSASCAPGSAAGSKLCQLCAGDCSRTHREPFYGCQGSLQDGAGDVAFVTHHTVPDSEKPHYELLCRDGSRAPLDEYRTCHLARVSANAVVSRKDPQLADLIWNSLSSAQDFRLFSSEDYPHSTDLMFKDSTARLVRVPADTDAFLYLGAEYVSIVGSLWRGIQVTAPRSIRWCAVGHAETAKCDMWSINNMGDDYPAIDCRPGTTVEGCIKMIMSGQADAMAVDAGQVYTAGKCGLVPAMVEQYSADLCSNPGEQSSYYAVAVVKRSSGLTWDTLKGHRSCHTGLGRSAGWIMPMGLIYSQTRDCDFTQFFSSGCAPGSELSSSFCAQCVGTRRAVGDESKCKASAEEQYYGYAGAFRCLVEGAGDVAFIKHTTVPENSNGKGPVWALGLNADDYQLICPGQAAAVDISEYATCNLGAAPANAVVTRPETRDKVVKMLDEQQAQFGGSDGPFRMFHSDSGNNLLFKDSTKCLQAIPKGTSYDTFLGEGYMTTIKALRQCSESTPELEISCAFRPCQQEL